MLRNDYETRSLKTLALLVLERNKKRNSDETVNINHVSLSQSALKQEKLKVAQQKYQYLYEERAGIYQFDAGLDIKEAEKNALSDVKKEFSDQYALTENSSEFRGFFEEFSKLIRPTIN